MKLRLAFEFTARRERSEQPAEEQHEHRDNDGTMVIHHDQPRYIGFAREEVATPDDQS